MIRFIEIGDQIRCEVVLEDDVPAKEFAWFDTRTERFIDIDGTQTWLCWADFEQDYNDAVASGHPPYGELQRYKRLYGYNDMDIEVVAEAPKPTDDEVEKFMVEVTDYIKQLEKKL